MAIVTTSSETETHNLGRFLGRQLFPGARLSLEGNLGAGKTALVRGIAAGLGVETGVKSPTFTLMHVYRGRLEIYHFDLYRLSSEHELDQIGWEEFTSGDGIALVEWGDKFPNVLLRPYLQVQITPLEGNMRNIQFTVCGSGEEYRTLLEELQAYAAGN